MAKSAAYKTNVYNHRTTDFANQYVALFNGSPIAGGTDLNNDLVGTMNLVALGAQTIAASKLQNDAIIEFTASADANSTSPATHIAVYSVNSSADVANLIDFEELPAEKSWLAGQRVFIPIAGLKIVE